MGRDAGCEVVGVSILDYTPPGMPFWVNGVRRQIESIGVVGIEPGMLPV